MYTICANQKKDQKKTKTNSGRAQGRSGNGLWVGIPDLSWTLTKPHLTQPYDDLQRQNVPWYRNLGSHNETRLEPPGQSGMWEQALPKWNAPTMGKGRALTTFFVWHFRRKAGRCEERRGMPLVRLCLVTGTTAHVFQVLSTTPGIVGFGGVTEVDPVSQEEGGSGHYITTRDARYIAMQEKIDCRIS